MILATIEQYAQTYNKSTEEVANDKSKIWVCLEMDDEIIGSGYIDNIFQEDFNDQNGKFIKQTHEVSILKYSYMEHTNGGRSNNKIYDSIDEYVADPLVKQLVFSKQKNIIQSGDPWYVDVDIHFKFNFSYKIFSVSGWLDDVIPVVWYSEYYNDVINGFKGIETWNTAEEAIDNTEMEDSLFGERYFPVLKAPKKYDRCMIAISGDFKNCSKPLYDDEFVYIGLRAKRYELSNITEIYEKGGVILKDKQWDWQ